MSDVHHNLFHVNVQRERKQGTVPQKMKKSVLTSLWLFLF